MLRALVTTRWRGATRHIGGNRMTKGGVVLTARATVRWTIAIRGRVGLARMVSYAPSVGRDLDRQSPSCFGRFAAFRSRICAPTRRQSLQRPSRRRHEPSDRGSLSEARCIKRDCKADQNDAKTNPNHDRRICRASRTQSRHLVKRATVADETLAVPHFLPRHG